MLRPPEIRHRAGDSPFGTGILAACNIKMGDLVMSERPLLVVPTAPPLAEEQSFQFEAISLVPICIMQPAACTAFFKLHNMHTEDGSGPIFGRIRTNCIQVPLKSEDGTRTGVNFVYSAIFNEILYINHSCIPNVVHRFSVASFSGEVLAIRDIKKDEELFMAYCDISMPAVECWARLEQYSFQCTCPACSTPTLEGDECVSTRVPNKE
ncbi:hypothetical protein H0H81_003420 [Sphagnurus paluster]|uniref:SET domain-containing protein n=1 Tax=Sphagnurus paluster TaxID=117069 RepID=A0A9P7GHR5_9AGAR|nr:hypothetical protein H0H81_003420 [Sphagnurus paluster]